MHCYSSECNHDDRERCARCSNVNRCEPCENETRTAVTWRLVSALRQVNRSIRSAETHGSNADDRAILRDLYANRESIKQAIAESEKEYR